MTDNIARALALKAQNQSSEGSTKVNKQIESLKEELAEKQPAGNYLTEETDPTVPEWAKQTSKPTYTASEIGALSEDTVIPSRTSELTNDSHYATESQLLSISYSNGVLKLKKSRFKMEMLSNHIHYVMKQLALPSPTNKS